MMGDLADYMGKYSDMMAKLDAIEMCIRDRLVVGLLVMSRFVWRVEVQGTERLEPEVITAALAEYGVRSGALASGIDAKTVERQMQIRFEEIAWITVNVEGSRVTAIIEEAVPPPAVVEDGIPTNLIAAETGFITKVEVQNGNPVVKPGDSVQAGDLLVSGIMDNKVGESRTAHARGQVYACLLYTSAMATAR